LGKKLYLRVGDLIDKNEKPQVNPNTSIKDVIYEISDKRLGTTAVIDHERIVGVITDGDIRRMLEKNQDIHNFKASDIMSENPKRIEINEMAVNAIEVMQNYGISQILVVDNHKYLGVLHFHDLLKEGII